MAENDIDNGVSRNGEGAPEQSQQHGAPQAAPAPQQPAHPAAGAPQQAPAQPYGQPTQGAPQPAQPYAPQPQYQPQPQPVFIPAPLVKLTGGMKFAWFVIGALVGIPGIILAWVCNVDKVPQVKNDAVKFAAIGFAVWIVLGIVFCLALGGMLAAAVAGYGTGAGYYGYYGSTW